MTFHCAWQIFRKDTRRLWWMILLTILLADRLVNQDSWRTTLFPGTQEGWLNILLPLAWSLLIALAVLEDPPTGDSPFWVTVPCRWPPFLMAKAAFIAIFVHVPYLIACIVIVSARGFDPASFLSVLLGKQVTLLALTLPAIAVATLVRNLTQFLMIAIVLATVLGAPESALLLSGANVETGVQVREIVLFIIATTAGLWIAIAGYRLRRTKDDRRIGIAAATVAAILWWLPSVRFDRLQAAMFGAPSSVAQTSIQLSTRGDSKDDGVYISSRPGSLRVSIPLDVPRTPSGSFRQIRQSEVQLREPGGRTDRAQTMREAFLSTRYGSPGAFVADLSYDADGSPRWQSMAIDPDVLHRVGDNPVSIDASAFVTYYREDNTVWMSLDRSVTVPAVGKCSAHLQGEEDPLNEQLKVSCESPQELPFVNVRIYDPQKGREWKGSLRESTRSFSDPAATWLSPVNRGDTYFSITDEERYNSPGGKFSIPREAMEGIRIAITPEFPQGSSLVHYELPNIKLRDYLVKR